MNNDANLASATHLNVIPAFAASIPSDTFAINYGRVLGLVADVDAILADAVDAYRAVVRLSKTRPNSSAWRAANRAWFRYTRSYAAATGLTFTTVDAKIRGIAGCFRG